MSETVFRKIIYSGICICGHSWKKHHIQLVANREAVKVMGPYFPGACLFYGCNENEGLDKNGNVHCFKYVDKDNPNENQR